MPILDRIFPERARFPDRASRRAAWRAAFFEDGGSYLAVALFATGVFACALGLVYVLWMLTDPQLPSLVPLSMCSLALLLSGIAGYYFTCWFFRRPIRLRLRAQLNSLGVRVCLRCGYPMPGTLSMHCAECGSKLPPFSDPPN
jgi:hypothetical protein